MMGLYGVSDWHAHEVIKEEPACVAPNKAPLSLVGHYMSKALASKAQLPLRFACPLINSLLLTVAGVRWREESVLCCSFQFC